MGDSSLNLAPAHRTLALAVSSAPPPAPSGLYCPLFPINICVLALVRRSCARASVILAPVLGAWAIKIGRTIWQMMVQWILLQWFLPQWGIICHQLIGCEGETNGLVFISFRYEHFSAQVNIHRKCANVTVIYQIKMFLNNFLKEFLLREESFNLAGRSFQIVGPETLNDLVYLFIYLLIRHFWVPLTQWPVANLT